MKQKTLQSTAIELEETLHRLSVKYSRTDVQTSQVSKSIYFKLFREDGTVSLRIRISNHPHINPQNIQNLICIGNHKGSLYKRDEWHKVIALIGNATRCIEIKSLGAKIIGEIKAKDKKQNKNFQNTLENIQNKIVHRTSPNETKGITEKEKMEILAVLFTGFATRFNLNLQKITIPSGYLFRLQYQNRLPVYVAASRHKPDSLPQDCHMEQIVLIGNYGTANFRYQDWKKFLHIILNRTGFIGKAHKHTLDQFIEKNITWIFCLTRMLCFGNAKIRGIIHPPFMSIQLCLARLLRQFFHPKHLPKKPRTFPPPLGQIPPPARE